tara:strand:+ start:276 stop:473 length:198 start_codon:yes stop_codon:yes gene_type:complete
MIEFIIKFVEQMECATSEGKSLGNHGVKREMKMCIDKGDIYYMAQGSRGAKLGPAPASLLKSLKA